IERAFVLPQDKREQRQLERMPLALNHPEAVLEDVRVLRRIGDEALFSQLGGETVVIMRVRFRIGGVGGTTFETVLAYHNRALLARLDVFRYQQDSVGENARPHIQHYLVAAT